jgi:hypothetical protein
MAYNAIVTRLRNVRQHPNADRVKLATCHGNQIVVGLGNTDEDLGVYFPSDGVLSHEFAHANNLYRERTMNSDPNEKPGMFDGNRRVRAQKFRGEISDGFWVPMSNFDFIEKLPAELLEEGYEFDTIKGIPICNKYINPSTLKAAQQNQPKKTKTAKTSIMFKELPDTEHLFRNLDNLDESDLLIISLKTHGTSHRIGNVLVVRNLSLFEKFLKLVGVKINEKDWMYLNGTRRVVLEESKRDGPQYHDPTIRDKAFNAFNGNLRKGETVYLEIVGFENGSKPIMSSVDLGAFNDKELVKKYSNNGFNSMCYKYGCSDGESDYYVYKITMTNEDGQSIDYSWDDIVKRCNELGVKHVPFIDRFTVSEFKLRHNIIDDCDFERKFIDYIAAISDGDDLIDPSHIREGVCVRVESGLSLKVYKNKGFNFKIAEGLVKDSGVIDIEEVESLK